MNRQEHLAERQGERAHSRRSTGGERRINSERLHKFADISAVDAFLQELSGRSLVVQLARQPGSREARWAHLLSGTPAAEVAQPEAAPSDLAALRAEVAALRDLVDRIAKHVGIT